MQLASTIAEMRAARRTLVGRVGFVPTMGALHAGHMALVAAAKQQCDAVVASIFVNPTQFAPTEDLDKYPRPFEQDRANLLAAGVDVLFAPSAAEMYPPGAATFVTVEELSSRLDGLSRPGHFRGVATVVAKLFHIVAPQFAFFGQKDAAQVAVLRRMVRDLNFDLEVIVVPTVRDPDGLAMSSRNVYLSPQERASALALSRALRSVEQLHMSGEHDSAALLGAARQALAANAASLPEVRLDYLEIVHPDTLAPLTNTAHGALAAIAAWIGSTRLIDNVVLWPAKR